MYPLANLHPKQVEQGCDLSDADRQIRQLSSQSIGPSVLCAVVFLTVDLCSEEIAKGHDVTDSSPIRLG